jgi:hypothetical protein
LNSRWRRLSFVRNDNRNRIQKDLRVVGTGPFKLELNGWIRTVVANFTINDSGYAGYNFDSSYYYQLCDTPEEMIGGSLYIQLQDGNCVAVQNPAISLDGFESDATNIFKLPDNSLDLTDEGWSKGEKQVYLLRTSLFNNSSFSAMCSKLPLVPETGDEPVFGKLSNGTWLMFDPRLDLMTNTLSSPAQDGGKEAFAASGGKTFCSNAPRTFLNEDQCQLSLDACNLSSNSNAFLELENSTIAVLNNLTDRYVYAITGLLVKYEGIVLEHPCTPGLRSRWEPKDLTECNPTDLYADTQATLSEIIYGAADRNPFIRDIYFPKEGKKCAPGDTEPEIEIEVNGECWRRVHDEHMSIFDVSIIYKDWLRAWLFSEFIFVP